MAEKEEAHAQPHKRNTHANRGRSSQNRLYHHLGVRDLREILDRKRSERGELSIPPPDPSFNYLKDPLRENAENQEHQPRSNSNRKNYNKHQSNNNFKRDKDHRPGSVSNQPKNRDIENPLNIRVEFSTSTGEHIYKVDESTVLPTIKHVPDRLPPQNKPFRGRGRGRGRGRNYQTWNIRSRKPTNENSPGQNAQLEESQHVTDSLEENWDDDLKVKNVDEESEDYKTEELHDYEDAEEHLEYEEVPKTAEDQLEEGLQNLKLDQPLEQAQKLEENTEKNDSST